jgi:hypothetical protein
MVAYNVMRNMTYTINIFSLELFNPFCENELMKMLMIYKMDRWYRNFFSVVHNVKSLGHFDD